MKSNSHCGSHTPYAEHIRRLVNAAPPLTNEQRSRLSTIFRPGATRPVPVEQRAAA